MIRRILLPLERGDDDGGAVAFAGVLARRRRLEILLLRVEERPVFGPFGFGWSPAWRAGELDPVKSRLDVEKDVRTRVLSAEAVTPTAALDLAGRQSASLILLPYREERPLLRMMYGSTSDRILRDATVPVLAVPGPARPVSRILYLFDGGRASVPGLRHVIDFAQLFEAEVSLLRIALPSFVDDDPSVEERLRSMLRRRDVGFRLLSGSDGGIPAVSREGADLVVLSKTPQTGKACTALARRLLRHTSVPLLLTSEGPVPSLSLGADAPLRVGI